ncbi:uncharacterized protein LOC132792402 [Drosophila nasuta]|uniref:uncharacterized protein LOC132792402 n=1 Tax=Drosophila nasuta TaxID=42062 RepID=UPI00295F37B2|nr:uncharacterized protein LOC132792402 [Drosophila nasuta]
MVHQNRTPSKAIPAKHLSPMRSMDVVAGGKYAMSASPADSFLRNNRLTVNSSSSGSNSSSYSANATAYKYNNMVNNNREQFNALHFC